MKTNNLTDQRRGEAVTIGQAALSGTLVNLRGAAAAAFAGLRFAHRCADSFGAKWETEGHTVSATQRDDVRAVYSAAAARALAHCGIVPASRAVLFGYGARRRVRVVEGGVPVLVEGAAPSNLASRIGARGLLPFGALHAWRKALRGAARDARSMLNGKSGSDVLFGSRGGDEGSAAMAARGVGDGGAPTRGAFMRASGGADAAAAWDRGMGHLVECLRAYWLCGSKRGSAGASQRWQAGLGSDLALVESMRETCAGEGFAHWTPTYIGNGRSAANAAKVAVGKLARHVACGDRLLTDKPQAVALAFVGAGFLPFVGAGMPRALTRCACHVCQGIGARLVNIVTVDELGGVVGYEQRARNVQASAIFTLHGGACVERSLASCIYRMTAPRLARFDSPQAVRWVQALTPAEARRVALTIGRGAFNGAVWVACRTASAVRLVDRLLVAARKCCDKAATGCCCALALVQPVVPSLAAAPGLTVGVAALPAPMGAARARRARLRAQAAADAAAARYVLARARAAALMARADAMPAVIKAAARVGKSARKRQAWARARMRAALQIPGGAWLLARREGARRESVRAADAADAARRVEYRAAARRDAVAETARQARVAATMAVDAARHTVRVIRRTLHAARRGALTSVGA